MLKIYTTWIYIIYTQHQNQLSPKVHKIVTTNMKYKKTFATVSVNFPINLSSRLLTLHHLRTAVVWEGSTPHLIVRTSLPSLQCKRIHPRHQNSLDRCLQVHSSHQHQSLKMKWKDYKRKCQILHSKNYGVRSFSFIHTKFTYFDTPSGKYCV